MGVRRLSRVELMLWVRGVTKFEYLISFDRIGICNILYYLILNVG
jgi:hypothetical protein